MSDRGDKLRAAIAADDQRSAEYEARRETAPDDALSLAAQFSTFLETDLVPHLEILQGEFAAAGRAFQYVRAHSDSGSQTFLLMMNRPGQDRAPLRFHLNTSIGQDGEVNAELERLRGTESEGATAITPCTGAGIADFITDTYIIALTRPDE